MGSYGRNYVRDNGPMYRTVVVLANGRVTYYGPYATVAAARGQRRKSLPGWVEVCYPVWEKLEE